MMLVGKALGRLPYLPIILVSTYVLFLSLVLHPQFQAHNIFLHSINYPFHVDLSQPEKIKGLKAGRVRSFTTLTSDGVRIAAWHLLPDSIDAASTSSSDDDWFDRALCERPTLLYFHGNAMNRAAPFRIQSYAQFTALNVNVVAIDYRGFGDSQGTPSEEGVQRDARAAYRWIRKRQRQAGHNVDGPDAVLPAIFIAGQSLGTGVASRLALDLVNVGHAPEGLFLIAPYTSIRSLLTSYKIAGLIPLFWPLGLWKVLSDLADRNLYTRFESDKAVYQIIKRGASQLSTGEEAERYGDLAYPLSETALLEELGLSSTGTAVRPHIVISHADDDPVIPHTHGRSLLQTIADALGSAGEALTTADYPWGQTLALHDAEDKRTFVLVRSHKGGHNGVPDHTVKLFSSIVDLEGHV